MHAWPWLVRHLVVAGDDRHKEHPWPTTSLQHPKPRFLSGNCPVKADIRPNQVTLKICVGSSETAASMAQGRWSGVEWSRRHL